MSPERLLLILYFSPEFESHSNVQEDQTPVVGKEKRDT